VVLAVRDAVAVGVVRGGLARVLVGAGRNTGRLSGGRAAEEEAVRGCVGLGEIFERDADFALDAGGLERAADRLGQDLAARRSRREGGHEVGVAEERAPAA